MFGSFLCGFKKSVGCSAVFTIVGCGLRFAVVGLILRAAFAVSVIRVNFNNKSEILAEGYTAGSAASRVRTSASAVAVGAFARRLVHIIVVVIGLNIVVRVIFCLFSSGAAELLSEFLAQPAKQTAQPVVRIAISFKIDFFIKQVCIFSKSLFIYLKKIRADDILKA